MIYRSATAQGEKPKRRYFRGRNSHKQLGHVTVDNGHSRRGIFGGSVLQLYSTYVLRSTIGLFSVSYTLLVYPCECLDKLAAPCHAALSTALSSVLLAHYFDSNDIMRAARHLDAGNHNRQ